MTKSCVGKLSHYLPCKPPAIVNGTSKVKAVSGSTTLDALVLGTGLMRRHTNPLSPGSLLAGRFRIVHEVGSGGMGRVYKAIDEKLDRRVALKCANEVMEIVYRLKCAPPAK